MATQLGERTVRAALKAVAVGHIADNELLARFVKGDETGFEAIVSRHAGLVLGVCRRMLPTVQDAEDACQAVFLVLARKAKTGQWRSSIANWLYTTARRIASRANRAAKSRKNRESRTVVPATVSLLDQMTGREAFAALDEELEKLPAIYREPLVLCYLQGLIRDEAAMRLGVPTATLKTRLDRGRKRLAAALTKRGIVIGAGLMAAATTSAEACSPSLLDDLLRAATGSPSAAVAELANGVAVSGIGKWLLATMVFIGIAALGIGLGRGSSTAATPLMEDTAIEQPEEKPEVETSKKAEPKKQEEMQTIVGRVIGPDGKPVRGAIIRDVTYNSHAESTDNRAIGSIVAESDADGKFNARLPIAKQARHGLIATAPAVGLAWIEPSRKDWRFPEGELTFKLVSDRPIEGRVVDTEGKPVVGANIGVIDIIVPLDGNMDRLVTSVRQNGFGSVGQWNDVWFVPPKIGIGPLVTDKDGKFVLRGIGADRVVFLSVSGKGLARMSGFVFNRPGLDTNALNAGWAGRMTANQKGQHPVIYGPAPTFVVEKGFAIEGIVQDVDAGKPVPSCQIRVNSGFWDWVETTSDSQGKYRIDGLARGMYHYISTHARADSELMDRFVDFKDPAGFETVRFDVKLARGAVFTGRVIDKQTGKGVRVSFQILPKGDNPNLDRPEFESAGRDMTWKGTGSDGSFRIVTVPGKSEIRVSTTGCDSLFGQMFSPYRPHKPFTVDLTAGKEKETVVELDRGQTAERTCVDPSGKPLTGLLIAGQSVSNDLLSPESTILKFPAGTATATVYGLAPDESRQVLFVHLEQKLARLVSVKAATKESVKLYALQPVSGRFTDTDGKPLAGLSVSISYNDQDMGRAIETHTKFTTTATTDAEGRFVIADVVPEMPFTMTIRKGRTNYEGAPRIGTKRVLPGFPLKLDDRKVAPVERTE